MSGRPASARIRIFILLFGIVNASLYAGLLPLWEGFDEAFHYGYVESLWQTRQLPALGRTVLPDDVFRSFRLAPVSFIVNRWLPETTSFDVWFSLPTDEKEQRRRELDGLPAVPGGSARPNYEAHHPPLAYMLLAAPDWLLSKAAITTRVLILRLAAAISSTVLLYLGATALFQTLDLPECFANAALFTIFCSQMLYATIAHVSNDWLAVGLSSVFLAAIAGLYRHPSGRAVLRTAVCLTAGLLTKAYFLVFAMLTLGVSVLLLWRRRIGAKRACAGALLLLALAGPWYVRNVTLYGNVAGTLEEFEGTGIRQALAAAPRINWLAVAAFEARGSLWTGNNSFTTFSQSTLNAILGLIIVALAGWGLRRNAIQPGERIVFAAILLFSVAVGYAACAAIADKHGQVPGASPWYTQVLLVPVAALMFLGMSRWKRAGRALAICTMAVWTWILVATWTVKLFPMYSGAGMAPMRLHGIWEWYAHRAVAEALNLALLALAPAALLYAGLAASLALAITLMGSIIHSLFSQKL